MKRLVTIQHYKSEEEIWSFNPDCFAPYQEGQELSFYMLGSQTKVICDIVRVEHFVNNIYADNILQEIILHVKPLL